MSLSAYLTQPLPLRHATTAIAVASGLAKAFNTDVNGLPLSLDLSWLEQKAVAVLLTLLHLGISNIRWVWCGGMACR